MKKNTERCDCCGVIPTMRRHGSYLASSAWWYGFICWGCVRQMGHARYLAVVDESDREMFKDDEQWSLYDGAMS